MFDALTDLWPTFAAVATVLLTVIAALHAVVYKRDVRASIGWVGLILVAPGVGALLYFLLGINRVSRRVRARMAERNRLYREDPGQGLAATPSSSDVGDLAPLAEVTRKVTGRGLTAGNRIEPLDSGDEAYPAMLTAIEEARHSIHLQTYIFDRDAAGLRFAEALGRAVDRGVAVRVILDDVGARYSFPSIIGPLRRKGVQVARFMRTVFPWRFPYINLRSHRKVLVVDGRLGFTGGINIREGHILADDPTHPVRDLHFSVEGPVVAHLQASFLHDWSFCTGENLGGTEYFPALAPAGQGLARGIADGPDEDFDRLRLVLFGAIASAQRSLRIMTPYFLPDQAFISALNTAAMRGIDVRILLPGKNNLVLVHWASLADHWQVLEHGCRLYLSPPPFDHSKLFIVDDAWVLIGSANWDPRSLRLNFEYNVECYDREFAGRLGADFDARLARAREISFAEVMGRPFRYKVRDNLARLLSPYL